MLSAQIELLEAVKAKIAALCPALPTVSVGALPVAGGISMEPAAGYNGAVFLNRNVRQILPLLFLSKHQNQMTAADRLYTLCNALQSAPAYASGGAWEWETAETATTPQYIGQDDGNGLFLYSAIVNIQFILKE